MIVEIDILEHNDVIDSDNLVENLINRTDAELIKFKKDQKHFDSITNNYKIKFSDWNDDVLKYSRKLIHVLNEKNIRKEFIDYVNEKYEHCIVTKRCDGNYINIVDFLDRNIFLEFDEYDHILKKFRDDKRNDLMKHKPIKPPLRIFDPRLFMLSRLTPFINKFKVNIKDLKYVLIRFKIPLILFPKISFAYYDKNKYNIKKRYVKIIYGKSEPECR